MNRLEADFTEDESRYWDELGATLFWNEDGAPDLQPVGGKRGIKPKTFWVRVDMRDPEQCWNWLGTAQTGTGYGLIKLRPYGKQFRAHRVSWELMFGPVPPNLEVCHSCDRPSCVNPFHLFVGTHRENMRDAARKGRTHKPTGHLNPNVKLDRRKVLEIRRLRATGMSYLKIARVMGVAKNTVEAVITGRTWGHV